MKINYVTGNKKKLKFANLTLKKFGIEVEQKELEVHEIQGENYLEISIKKAEEAFRQLQEPLFITDTSWEVPALSGFPGPYMKSISKWFRVEDWLNLMKDKKDRTINVIDIIVYIDKEITKIFTSNLNCEFATEPASGFEDYSIIHRLVKCEGKYICEYTSKGEGLPKESKAWEEFAEFLKSKSNYNFFAKFYDHMMGDREETAKKIVALINKHNKKARSILDLACGTGEILRFFKERYMVEGIDNSKEMIDIARYKFPELVFYQGSMTKFYNGKKYDVIMSNFDSVNHLLELDKWIDFFTVCKQSLTKGGILIFDINTLEKLDAMCIGKKFKQDFGGIYTRVEVEKVANQKYNWQLEFFDSDTKEKISEENILETSFDKKVILKILKTLFKKVEVIDFDKNVKGGQNRRLYFVCKS
jgi:non-canonical purine NTP pyrophosphatase (RdgB/HAM1 family)